MIKVANCVIHEIHKEAKKKGAILDQSEAMLNPDDEFVKKLLTHIHKSFGDEVSLKNTHFEPNQETKFSSFLLEYINADNTNNFFNFSVQSLADLKEKIENENFAVGGYYVFADYYFDERRFLSVMVIRKNKDAINLNKVGNVHTPTASENVNTEKIAMGFRLNYGLYHSTDFDKNYIALLTNQSDKELSGYFKKWVNAAGVISAVKNSSVFVKIIKSIDLPKDENGNEIYTREEFQKIAFDFAESNKTKQINVKAFSSQVYGDGNENYIMNFATANSFVIDPNFKIDNTTFKRLITIRAKVKGIELNVDYEKLNEQEVDVDVEQGIIIIRSAELAKQINDQKQ